MTEVEYNCPVCKQPLMSPNETCSGSFTDKCHPLNVLAQPMPQPASAETVPPEPGEPDG